ncbi:MAG: riboflavin synthase [Candidatus Polarisedimenticolia bacterium]
MFTGIVTETGVLETPVMKVGGLRLRIQAPSTSRGLPIGGSVSVDGVCLTAVDVGRRGFCVDVVPETLRRTTLGSAAAGRRVNLERPLSAAAELGGHFVQGHVDARAEVAGLRRRGGEVLLEVLIPRGMAGLIVPKGSIAINGVSLTVAAVKSGRFSVALIPHTLERTNLGDLRAGDPVNLEADILGKYVAAFLARRS